VDIWRETSHPTRATTRTMVIPNRKVSLRRMVVRPIVVPLSGTVSQSDLVQGKVWRTGSGEIDVPHVLLKSYLC
jgi:hypothetical protein